jgi:triacylglycerol lipase
MSPSRCVIALTTVVVSLAFAAGAVAAPPADTPPPGANDWSCRPSADHPRPVVLVHGTFANMSLNWSQMSPRLASRGWCVFALTYGRDPRSPPPFDQNGGLLPIERSAEELAAFVNQVLAATGAAKVDVVGHSQGSLMPNYYVKFLGGAAKVENYVGIAPLWKGTNLPGTELLDPQDRYSPRFAELMAGPFCGSCPEMVRGSEFLKRMTEGGAAVAGVSYTMLMTRYDEAVHPYTSGYLEGARNIVVQDGCPTDFAEHGALVADPVTTQHVVNALDASHARPVKCSVVLP